MAQQANPFTAALAERLLPTSRSNVDPRARMAENLMAFKPAPVTTAGAGLMQMVAAALAGGTGAWLSGQARDDQERERREGMENLLRMSGDWQRREDARQAAISAQITGNPAPAAPAAPQDSPPAPADPMPAAPPTERPRPVQTAALPSAGASVAPAAVAARRTVLDATDNELAEARLIADPAERNRVLTEIQERRGRAMGRYPGMSTTSPATVALGTGGGAVPASGGAASAPAAAAPSQAPAPAPAAAPAAGSLAQAADLRRRAGGLLALGESTMAAQLQSQAAEIERRFERNQDRAEDQAWRAGESRRAQGNADRAQANSDRQFALQQDEARRAAERDRANAERARAEDERRRRREGVGEGYERGEDGVVRFIPGSQADPAVIERNARARDNPPGQRPLSETARGKLGESGGDLSTATRLHSTFRDDFGGQPGGLGDVSNWLGRTAGIGGEQSQWWQDYTAHRNVLRNRLFGAALTSTEAKAFERADINPGMAPSQIRTNLERQRQAAESAAARIARSLQADGYRPEAIAEAVGVPLDRLSGVRLMEPDAYPAVEQDAPRGGGRAPQGGRPVAPARPGGQAAGQGGSRPRVTDDDSYARLPSGAEFEAPDGSIRRKP